MPKKSVYKLIITSHNKQVEYIGYYHTARNANKKFHEMVKESEKVKFPVLNINVSRTITPAKYDLVLLKKKDEDDDSNVTLLRNEYGSYVEHETTSENWIVYDKAPYYKEETFWVYGFNPFVQRKTFDFIYDELVKPYSGKKDQILNIYIYKNKLILDSLFHVDLVTCKNKDDAIRLHNTIQKYATKDKLKYILFSGDWSKGDKGRASEKKIQELTNWPMLKIQRYSTRP